MIQMNELLSSKFNFKIKKKKALHSKQKREKYFVTTQAKETKNANKQSLFVKFKLYHFFRIVPFNGEAQSKIQKQNSFNYIYTHKHKQK